MNPVWFDPERAASTATTWVDWGNRMVRAAGEIEHAGRHLQLEPALTAAYQLLSTAAADLWTAGTAMQMLVDRVVAGDSMPDRNEVMPILRAAAAGAGCSVSLPGGERDGTGNTELRSPYAIATREAVERGRSILVRALADTGDSKQIRPDEFELVALGDERFLVVLPGVTDLSRLDIGWSATHRSVRDLDKSAVWSWPTTSVADNRYAQMVWQALVDRLPIGSELVIVGHSYGADTALDLAADPMFNGAAGFSVTHVVAAGYDTRHQHAAVPEATAVLVLENRNDRVLDGERVGASGLPVVGPIIGLLESFDPFGDSGQVADDRAPADVVVASFEGASVGHGHDPDNYAGFLAGATAPAVVAFLAGVGAHQRRSAAPAVAIDLSVPTHKS